LHELDSFIRIGFSLPSTVDDSEVKNGIFCKSVLEPCEMIDFLRFHGIYDGGFLLILVACLKSG
jgi:hypothetical protein